VAWCPTGTRPLAKLSIRGPIWRDRAFDGDAIPRRVSWSGKCRRSRNRLFRSRASVPRLEAFVDGGFDRGPAARTAARRCVRGRSVRGWIAQGRPALRFRVRRALIEWTRSVPDHNKLLRGHAQSLSLSRLKPRLARPSLRPENAVNAPTDTATVVQLSMCTVVTAISYSIAIAATTLNRSRRDTGPMIAGLTGHASHGRSAPLPEACLLARRALSTDSPSMKLRSNNKHLYIVTDYI